MISKSLLFLIFLLLMNAGPIIWGINIIAKNSKIQDRKMLITCVTLLLLSCLIITLLYKAEVENVIAFTSIFLLIISIIIFALGVVLVKRQRLKSIGVWIILISIFNAIMVVYNIPMAKTDENQEKYDLVREGYSDRKLHNVPELYKI